MFTPWDELNSPGPIDSPEGFGNASQPALDSYQAGSTSGSAFNNAQGDFQGAQLTQMPPQTAYGNNMPEMAAPPPQMGPPAPTAQAPQMPEAYTTNRMESWGMPKMFQAGEQMVDDWRAKKWDKNQGMEDLAAAGQSQNSPVKPVPVEVDAEELLNAGGDPQEAFARRQAQGNTGSSGAMAGQATAEIAKMVAKAYMGGGM